MDPEKTVTIIYNAFKTTISKLINDIWINKILNTKSFP